MIEAAEGESSPSVIVMKVDRVELKRVAGLWSHQCDNNETISVFWQDALSRNPHLFNGPFFILDRWHLSDGVLFGECRETNYAAYLHWRANGFASAGRNAFAMPVLRANNGAVLVGRMAPWTANAGTWYMPAGSIDADDISGDGRIDIESNMCREVAEEIGITITPAMMEKNWTLVFTRGRLAMFREIHFTLSVDALCTQIRAYLAKEEQAELDQLRFITCLHDINDLPTPPFLRPFLQTILPP